MGVLDHILEYKKQRDAQTYADIMAIPTAVQTFSNARQQAKENLLKELSLNVSAASSGLKIDPNTGSITRDDSLKSDLEKLIEKGKAAEAAKNMGDRGLYETITGKSTIQNTPAAPVAPTGPAIAPVEGVDQFGEAPEQTSIDQASIDQITAPEIDTFTGKLTTAGEKQDAKNKLILEGQQQKLKNHLDVEGKRQEKLMVGEGADSGKLALAKEGLQNIEDIKEMLYPDGTGASFDRGAAFASNIPGVDLPVLGRVTPRSLPFNSKAQNLARKMGTALSARQIIQTGVAARPDEIARLFDEFAPRLSSGGQSSLDALNQLQDFYRDYIKTTAPGRINTTVKSNKPKAGEIKFTPEQEKDIADTAKHYGKTVEQVKADIKKKGINPWA